MLQIYCVDHGCHTPHLEAHALHHTNKKPCCTSKSHLNVVKLVPALQGRMPHQASERKEGGICGPYALNTQSLRICWTDAHQINFGKN